MSAERLDPRVVEKVSGPAWESMRPVFDRISAALLAVSPTATGALTTIYVKYSAPETKGQPYAVVWIKKATEIVVGLALPDDCDSEFFVDAPRGCKYSGLTKYLVLRDNTKVPEPFSEWAQLAYSHGAGT
jgi:hypothetical protein